MGMADKASMQVGGVPILQRIVGCLPGHEVWVVGAEVSGGPVAGIAVGVTQTDRDLVAVFAGDQPFVAEALPSLRAAVVGARRCGADREQTAPIPGFVVAP